MSTSADRRAALRAQQLPSASMSANDAGQPPHHKANQSKNKNKSRNKRGEASSNKGATATARTHTTKAGNEIRQTLSKGEAMDIADDTLRRLDAGEYVNVEGHTRSLRAAVDACVRGTVFYRRDSLPKLDDASAGALAPALAVVHATSLEGVSLALSLAHADGDGVDDKHAHRATATATATAGAAAAGAAATVGLLNFASAKHPGGGFRSGARAQEESIARSSALYPAIVHHTAYVADNRDAECLYSNGMLFSPAVPVFKDDAGRPLRRPQLVDVVTAPAPNLGVAAPRLRRCKSGAHPHLNSDDDVERYVERLFARRIDKALRVFAAHRQRTLVLGAWGCGVFRNRPERVARAFAEALAAPHLRGAFDTVLFAVHDSQTAASMARVFDDAVVHEYYSLLNGDRSPFSRAARERVARWLASLERTIDVPTTAPVAAVVERGDVQEKETEKEKEEEERQKDAAETEAETE